jgi:hypothetical protein
MTAHGLLLVLCCAWLFALSIVISACTCTTCAYAARLSCITMQKSQKKHTHSHGRGAESYGSLGLVVSRKFTAYRRGGLVNFARSPSRGDNAYVVSLSALSLGRRRLGVVGVRGDGARVGPVREADEAALAPGRAPRVAHLPVAARGGDAHGLHACWARAQRASS